MFIPLNRTVLDTLGDIDLLALIKLAKTCRTLSQFISEQVLTLSHLKLYLKENQYAFLHDSYRSTDPEGPPLKVFHANEISFIVSAYEMLRCRDPDSFLFDSLVQYLGPLIWRTPLHEFQSPKPAEYILVASPKLDIIAAVHIEWKLRKILKTAGMH